MNLEDYLNKYIIRYDKGDLKYFSPSYFEGLNMDNFSFSYLNKTLRGGYFYYSNYKKDELIIFVNGIGCGYEAYMSEIEHLAKAGFKVLSIDNLGVFTSDGENIRSLSEALAILDHLLIYLSSFSWYGKTKIKLVGHSLGGYAVSNIYKYHPEIKAVVSISGFISIKTILNSFDANEAYDYELKMNPNYVNSNALEVVMNSSIPMLFIHSIDDPIVSYNNFLILKDNTKNSNLKFISVNHKKHNPLYTIDGVDYMIKEFSKIPLLKDEKERKEYINQIDFYRIVKMDDELFKEVLDILNK